MSSVTYGVAPYGNFVSTDTGTELGAKMYATRNGIDKVYAMSNYSMSVFLVWKKENGHWVKVGHKHKVGDVVYSHTLNEKVEVVSCYFSIHDESYPLYKVVTFSTPKNFQEFIANESELESLVVNTKLEFQD